MKTLPINIISEKEMILLYGGNTASSGSNGDEYNRLHSEMLRLQMSMQRENVIFSSN